MERKPAWAGFVLAGGASSRMGRDKASLPFLGKTLVEHVAACVEQAAGSVTLVGAPERYAALPFPRLADTRAGWGPLAAIHTTLEHSAADWNLIVACDMPELSAEFLQLLMAQAQSSGCDCLIPVSPAGQLEPLCAAYRKACLRAIGPALDRGVRKITEGLAGLRIANWPVAESHWFSNVNTPEDWLRQTHG